MPLLLTRQYSSQCWNETAAAHLEVISTHRPYITRVVDARTENKCSWQSVDIITSLVMWRRNIHSLLTLAAEPSEPSVSAAVQPRGWPVSQGGWGLKTCQDLILGPNWKSTAEVWTDCTFRKERAAGVVPAFTLLQKKSQVHFARASNTTFRSHQDQF